VPGVQYRGATATAGRIPVSTTENGSRISVLPPEPRTLATASLPGSQAEPRSKQAVDEGTRVDDGHRLLRRVGSLTTVPCSVTGGGDAIGSVLKSLDHVGGHPEPRDDGLLTADSSLDYLIETNEVGKVQVGGVSEAECLRHCGVC
jgi:hypothetical protein